MSSGLTGCAVEIGDRVRRAAQRGSEDAAVREAYDRSRRAVTGDRACTERAARDGRDVVLVDADGTPLPDDQQPAGTRVGATGAGFNFVPGDRALFAGDFSADRVGDFPRRLEFRRGTMEVAEWRDGRVLAVKTKGAFDVVLASVLPEAFAMELEVQSNDFTNDFRVYLVDAEGRAAGTNFVQVFPVRATVDGRYVKVFVGQERVANVPNADLGRSARIRFDVNDVRGHPVYLSGLRIAAGGRDL